MIVHDQNWTNCFWRDYFFIFWVRLCSSFKGRLLCVGYVPSNLVSVSSIGIVERSISVTRCSAFAITIRERHLFFSHQSILNSTDCFISNFYPTPAWGVPIVAAMLAKSCSFLVALSIRITLTWGVQRATFGVPLVLNEDFSFLDLRRPIEP